MALRDRQSLDPHKTDMQKTTAWTLLVIILLVGSFFRQYRLLNFPLHGTD